jgi:hypothetical protein
MSLRLEPFIIGSWFGLAAGPGVDGFDSPLRAFLPAFLGGSGLAWWPGLTSGASFILTSCLVEVDFSSSISPSSAAPVFPDCPSKGLGPVGWNSWAPAFNFGIPAPGCGVSGLADDVLLLPVLGFWLSLKAWGCTHVGSRFLSGPRSDRAASLRSLRDSVSDNALTISVS